MLNLSQNIVAVSALAEFFECTERTIQNWVTDYGAPRDIEGEYNFQQFVKWRLNFLGNEIKKLEAGGDKKYELETEKLLISNKRDWVRFQKEIHQLVPLELVRQAYVSDSVAYKNAAEALENKIYLVIDANAEQRAAIKKEFDDMRKQIGTELRLNEKEDFDDFNEPEEIEQRIIEGNKND